jgi:tRNA(Ile)-lysidine synthase TilS/MesJ
MRLNLLKRRVVTTMLGLCLLIGIGVASSVTTQAQWQDDQWRRQQQYERERLRRQRQWEREQRRNNGYGYGYGVSFDLRQTALNAGYNKGIKEGRKDREHNDRFEYRDEGDYQNATIDYSSRLGNRELYRQFFRQGFANGYRDGYGGY